MTGFASHDIEKFNEYNGGNEDVSLFVLQLLRACYALYS